MRLGRLFLKLARRRKLHADLEAELAFHHEMAAAAGNARSLGNTAALKESALDLWRLSFLENLWRDAIYGARALRRSPALVAAALLSLGLGIGVNTTLFSLGVEFLFSEPDVRDASSLVHIRAANSSHSSAKVVDLIRDSGVFQDVAGEQAEGSINWNDGAGTHRIFSEYVTKNYFTALGIPIEHGRGILPSDPAEVVVLRHEFWRRRFQSDLSVIGRSLNLDGRLCTVVGILPEGQRTLLGYGYTPDIYVPRYREDTRLAIYARLKPGMGLGAARAAMEAVAARLDEVAPERWKYAGNSPVSPVGGFARLMQDRGTLPASIFFGVLMVLAALVLSIACVNVASLLLARANARSGELAVRLALGASRGRLLQQLLVESLLLAGLGAGIGLAMAEIAAKALAAVWLPLPLPVRVQVEPDWRVAIYAAFLTVATAAACGFLPAWRAVKESISPRLSRERGARLRQYLVAAQLAVSVIVLSTGLLFLRNLLQATAISPGFDLRHTVRADVNLPPLKYKDGPRVTDFINRELRALAALPGMECAAASRMLPFIDTSSHGTKLTFPRTGQTMRATFYWNAVSPDYFRVMAIPLLQGRVFSDADKGGTKVVVVNRTFATRYLQGSAVGKSFIWSPEETVPYLVAGVVEDAKNKTIGEEPQPQLYEPLAQIAADQPRIQFVMRSAIPPMEQLEPVRQALRIAEPGAGTEVATLYSGIGMAFLPSQVGAALMGGIGVLGLLLAAVGLYGVMVYSVTRRTRELGLRMALGATRGAIRRMILLEAAKLVGAGSAAGLFIAAFVTRPLAMFLVPGLSPGDPLTMAGVLLVLLAAGLAATYGPVGRALAVDPNTALRWE